MLKRKFFGDATAVVIASQMFKMKTCQIFAIAQEQKMGVKCPFQKCG
jgi:hypothetical protein